MPPIPQQNPAPLQATIETILDDRLCSHCSYNLKGLDVTGVCPECGEPCSAGVSALGHRVIDNSEIGQASLSFLLPHGLAIFGCGISGLALASFAHLTIVRAATPLQSRIALAAATIWFVAVLILLRDRPKARGGLAGDTDDAPWPVKLLLALTQPAWIAVAALAYLEQTGAQWATEPKWIALVFAAHGLPAVPWLLSYTALWSINLSLAARLRAAASILSLGGLIAGTIQVLWSYQLKWAYLFTIVEVAARFAWLLAFAATSLFAFQLLIDVRWAIINARQRAARDRRLFDRARRYADAIPKATPIESAPIPPEVAALLEDSTIAAHSPPTPPEDYIHPHDDARMEPRTDVKPYPLEDTAPP